MSETGNELGVALGTAVLGSILVAGHAENAFTLVIALLAVASACALGASGCHP